MAFNLSTFLFELVNFVVLAYILHRLLYRPLRAAIDKRRADLAQTQSEAQTARADASAMQKRLQTELADVEKQRQEMVQQTRALAEIEHQKLTAESERTIACRQEEVRAALQRQREDALRALRAEVRSAAVELAERLLQEAAGTTLQSQLARRLTDTLTQLPENQRSRVRHDWIDGDGVVLETASPLDPTSTQHISDAVAAVVGRTVKLVMESKPALVAGARLRIGGHVWDASLAGQLELIEQERNQEPIT